MTGVEGAVVGRPLTEAELVERAKRGDQDAYGDLVHAYQGIAFRTARRGVAERHIAQPNQRHRTCSGRMPYGLSATSNR